MDWLDYIVPVAALLALFAVVGLLVQSIRHGRALRRLEQRVADGGGAAGEVGLGRIAALQSRARTSQGGAFGGSALRVAGIVGAGVLVLAVAAGAGWYLFVRDDGDGATAAGRDRTTTTTARRPATTRATTAPLPPDRRDRVPANPPPLDNKAAFTVTVLNASGVQGAAANKVVPMVVNAGYSIGVIDNAPRSDLKVSVVMWVDGQRRVAWNVAKDLGITRATTLDGIAADSLGETDAVVLVGLDLAQG